MSSVYGEPRLTQDIDIVISPDAAKQRTDDLVMQLDSSDFLFGEENVRQAVASGELFQLLDKTESLKLDIYPRELIPGELQRSVHLELFEGITLPVVSQTDAALSKLIWVEKGSHRSRRDLRSIFKNSEPATQAIIREQATAMRLINLLDQVLSESDEIR
ncbi:MAG: nucleotidyl transferase AbiEii/AbiGii toxin family protein [Aureliella sp.]